MSSLNLPTSAMSRADKPRRNLLERLLNQGHRISIQEGRIHIEPANGQPVPAAWARDHQEELISQILERCSIPAYQYQTYSAGKYQGGRYPGIHLSFREISSGADAYTIFNAQVTRARTTRHGTAGSLLPPGHFRVQKGSKFLQFWRRTGLPRPRRLSSFHDYMTKLENIAFTGSLSEGNRLDKDSLIPVSIPYEQVRHPQQHPDQPDNARTIFGHPPDNLRPKPSDKDFRNPDNKQGVTGFSGTGRICCGTKVKGVTGSRESSLSGYTSSTDLRAGGPESQTVEEWLAAYDGKTT